MSGISSQGGKLQIRARHTLAADGEARAFLFENAFVSMIAKDAELRDMLLNGNVGGGGGYSKGARQSLRGMFKGAGGFVSVLLGRV
jgi:hypothetical protein